MNIDPNLPVPCKHLTDAFFNAHHETKAAMLCEPCPVKDECRQFAYDNRIEYGVWGGTTSHERRDEWRPECVKKCGRKAKLGNKKCGPCSTPGRKPKQKETAAA